jgi:branched-chain amino acid transport system permease protein
MGHAGFMAIGANASALLTIPVAKKAILLKNLPDALGQVAMPLVPALVGAGFWRPSCASDRLSVLRFKGHYLSVATLG